MLPDPAAVELIAPVVDDGPPEVVEWCDRIRAALGLEPLGFLLRGLPLNPWWCPVCRTVRAGSEGLVVEFTGDRLRAFWPGSQEPALEVAAPGEVARWSEHFDRGHIPDSELDVSRVLLVTC